MSITYNFHCDKCGNETYLEAENEYEKVLICENCAETYVIEHKKEKQYQALNIPKCPTCGSTNIKPITGSERAVSVIGLGLLSKKINKSFKCLNCKCTW